MKNFSLDNEPKIETGFRVPENYFVTLSEKINDKLPSETPKVIPLYKKKKVWMYSVAAVAVVSMSILLVQQFNTKPSLDSEFLENYISQNTSVSQDDIIDLLEQEDIEKLKVDYNLEEDLIEETLINSSDLEHYLTN
ncbi:hypothetical protein [Flavobacterium dankookense]|uniref:Uncharacterized protein n=1 Tax=Flavobacterium dankookense TaxID=706186 RepID=A0A4R6QF44_9FLAO|nr:hypothetical protein [Flavobacterium dankookense]TDP60887.1 hypothetical protein BC748_0489 [Flavobacterium dankookense]